jgi:hypothetical protein
MRPGSPKKSIQIYSSKRSVAKKCEKAMPTTGSILLLRALSPPKK